MIRCTLEETDGDSQILAVGINEKDIDSLSTGGVVTIDLANMEIDPARLGNVTLFFGDTQQDLIDQMDIGCDTVIANDLDDYRLRNEKIKIRIEDMFADPTELENVFNNIYEKAVTMEICVDIDELSSWVRSCEALFDFFRLHSTTS